MLLSSRRAWIEIRTYPLPRKKLVCRSPHGERGLKSTSCVSVDWYMQGRSPRGERGLKLPIRLYKFSFFI